MRGRLKHFMFTFILVNAVLLAAMPWATSSDEVVILPNHRGRKDYMGLGYYVVFGEVENRGNSAVTVMITATFYDEGGSKIGEEIGRTYLDVLLPGRKSPFEVLLTTAAASKVHSYELKVMCTAANPKPERLKILSSKAWIDVGQHLNIEGELENTGDSKALTVKVVLSCYDEAGRVIAASIAYIAEIGAHEKSEYIVSVHEWWISKYISSYSLYTESIEYTMAPPNFEHIPVTKTPSPSPTPSPALSPPSRPTPASTPTATPEEQQPGGSALMLVLAVAVPVIIICAAALIYRRLRAK